jgi:hypothetical protein
MYLNINIKMLGDNNEIHLLEYLEEKKDVKCNRLFKHEHEIWNLNPSPTNENIFFSIYNTGDKFKASLWNIPKANKDEGRSENLDELLTFESKYRFYNFTNLIKRIHK